MYDKDTLKRFRRLAIDSGPLAMQVNNDHRDGWKISEIVRALPHLIDQILDKQKEQKG